jgi:hypothetical protein
MAVQFKIPNISSSNLTYSFPEGFCGGMNISVSPDQIAANQSPDMSDMNYDGGGIPTKRRGLTKVNEQSFGKTPIRGMYDFYKNGSDKPIFLIAHGGKLYSYDEETDNLTDLCTGDVESFNDGPVSFISMNNKCFFLTGKQYLYYDGENPVGKVEDIAWVPTVTLGKPPDGVGGTPNERFNHLSQKWKESFSADGEAQKFFMGKMKDVTLSSNSFKAWIYGEEKKEDDDFTVDRENWSVEFNTPPPKGTDNVVIQFEATNLMNSSVITECTRIIEFGGKNDSIVFMTGNSSFPNTARYSWVYDPTYFPEDYDFNVGGDSRNISGWGRMNEYLITYKELGDQTLQWYSEITIDILGEIAFETYALNQDYGCIAPKSVVPAQGGLLALSDDGVVWTWPSLIKGQANCKIVSKNVNGRNGIAEGILDNSSADLKNAHAQVFNNKYYLHIGETTWILDLEYSDLREGITCWYPYKGLFSTAGVFYRRSDRLYIGSGTEGLLYKEQQAGDIIEYSDDGEAIDAWWTSPLLFLGGREWIKKFERINITFKSNHGANHILYFITDSGTEEIALKQPSGYFDARYFHAEFLCAGSHAPDYPNSQSEKIGIKAEYFQFKIRNKMDNRSLAILASMITYSRRKLVK